MNAPDLMAHSRADEPAIEVAFENARLEEGQAPELLIEGGALPTGVRKANRQFIPILLVSAAIHAAVAGGFAWYDRARAGMAGGLEIPVEIVVETIDNSAKPVDEEIRLDLPPPDLPPELVLPEPEPVKVAEALPEVELALPEPPPPLVLPEPEPEPVQVAEIPPPVVEPPPPPEPLPPPVPPEPEPIPPAQVAELQLPDVEIPPPEPPPSLFLPKEEPPAAVQLIQPAPLPPPPVPRVTPPPAPDQAAKREQERRKAAEEARLKREQEARRQAQAKREADARATAARPAAAPQAAAKPAAASAGDIATFRSRVAGKLASSRRYPDSAKSRGATGVAVVSFRIDPSGNPIGVSLAKSSGHADLDAETLAMVRRASPFPAPPLGAPTTFTAPINYNLR